jgi:serine/threonine-protein kinase
MLREARAQARLDHANICKVYEVGEIEGRPYIAMQLVRGEPLDRAARGMSLEHKLRTMAAVVEAVHAAHVAGLIHRDLKPANLLVEQAPDGAFVPYVLDFGIVHEYGSPGLTEAGELIGTPGYMSPEQARGEAQHVDRRSDVFSLGAILYEILGGSPAFPGDGRLAILIKVLHESPRPLRRLVPSLPPDVETIVMRCLEREPPRRYESARALADDLARYLRGEPILARPRGRLERLAAAVLRRKVESALLGAAALAVVVAAGLTVQARRSAAVRARVAREMGQEAERLGAWMRQAYLSRLHDTRPERKRLEERIRRIETGLASLDSEAAAAGHYALGRAYQSLHDYERARRHLEASWEHGHHTPLAAHALGRVLGALYRRELPAAERIRNADVRRARLDELDRLYKTKALHYLQSAGASSEEARDLLDAEIAFYEKRYDEAMRLATAARRGQPWLYEADVLSGDAADALADRERGRGHVEGALSHYDAAEAAYRRAAETGASDPTTHERLCLLALRRIDTLYFDRGAEIAPLVTRVDEECGRALQADPGRPRPHTLVSAGYTRLGEQEAKRGGDPTPPIERAIAAARSALELDPGNGEALRRLGDAYSILAVHHKARGLDPAASLALSVASLQHAVAAGAGDPGTLNSLGLAHWEVADHQSARGEDPRVAFTGAVAAFGKATELLPTYVHGLSNLGAVHKNLALDAIAHGRDPEPDFAAGAASLQRAIAAGPSYSYAYNNLGNVHLDRGQYLLDRGGDPSPELREALRLYAAASERNPSWAYPRANAGRAHHVSARHALARGEDPAPSIRDALSALASALALKADTVDAIVESVRVRVSEARHAVALGRSPEGALAEAERNARRGLRFNPASAPGLRAQAEALLARGRWLANAGRSPEAALAGAADALARAAAIRARDADIRLLQARASLLSAEWRVARRQGAEREVEAGLQHAAAALALNPTSADALLAQGGLQLLAAQTAADPARRREAAGAAWTALRRAVEINRWLTPEAQPLLDRARGLQVSAGS